MAKLAINGGTPVRSHPLPSPYLGTKIIGDEELDLLTEVVKKKLPFRDYGDGEPHMVKDFEKLAQEYFDMPYALGTATGSGASYCAIAGLGIGPGDEVIIPAFAWFTDFYAPVLLGATPVFADIDESLGMDPSDFQRKISSNTKAVIVVHYQGATNDMDQILEIAKANNVMVIEDCAQSCGAIYKGKKVGSLGDVSCFSFQQNKILSTGDGGLFLAKDPSVFERAVRFHDLGFVRPGLAIQLGGNLTQQQFCSCQFRMNEFTGAVALAQLRKLETHILSITRNYYWHIRNVLEKECEGLEFRKTGDPQGDAGITIFINAKTPQEAKWFKDALVAEGIRVGPSSGCCNLLEKEVVKKKIQVNPKLPPFGKGWPGENVVYSDCLCPNTNLISQSMVAIAIAPDFSDNDADDIAKAIIKVWQNRPEHILQLELANLSNLRM